MEMMISKRSRYNATPRVDTDLIAFNISSEDFEHVIDCLVSSITAKCIIEFGEVPREIE